MLNDGFEDELDKDFMHEAKQIRMEKYDRAKLKLDQIMAEDSEDDRTFILKEEDTEFMDEEQISSDRVYSRLMHEALQKVDYGQPVDEE